MTRLMEHCLMFDQICFSQILIRLFNHHLAVGQNVKITSHNATSAIVEWDPVPNAVRYKLCYREDGANQSSCMDVSAGANDKRFQVAVHGLKPGIRYHFSVENIVPGNYLYAET